MNDIGVPYRPKDSPSLTHERENVDNSVLDLTSQIQNIKKDMFAEKEIEDRR